MTDQPMPDQPKPRRMISSWAIQTILFAISQRRMDIGKGISSPAQGDEAMDLANQVSTSLWNYAIKIRGTAAHEPAVLQEFATQVLHWCTAHLHGVGAVQLDAATLLHAWGRQTLLNSMAVRANQLGRAMTPEQSNAALGEAIRVNDAVWQRCTAGRDPEAKDPELTAVFSREIFQWCSDHMKGDTPRIRG